ncbi:hypothetical protein OHB36_16065 [Streptomyces sp. NBC_00320]|uniref:hypothetical protein n=1 Tax=unclassified Streptomyces TaxID=2593676 RepID=UPI002255EA4A|nr:hypothetical protein [Streptomyces sp. NBC_00320]MCX5148276.1 hypothetical protein [Streptomyces sp. NBC_00320]
MSSREERPPETKPLEPVCPGIQISPSGPGWPTDVALSSLVMAPVGGGEESGAPEGGWNGNHVQLKGSGDGTYLRVGVLKPGVWVVSDPGAVLDPSGREVRGAQGCADPKKDAFGCFATSNLHIEVDYQPADRYWTFQWIETGIFLALSALLAGTLLARGSGPGARGDGPESASLVQVTRADGPGRAGLGRTGQLCSKRAQFTGAGVW